MNYISKTLPVGARVIDCAMPLSPAQAVGLKSYGVDAVVQYATDTTPSSRDGILSAGLGLILIGGFADKPNIWMPSADLGKSEGATYAKRALNLSYPRDCTLWIDIETPNPAATAQNVLDYGDTAADQIYGVGYDTVGGYFGYGCKVNSGQMSGMRINRYWKSLSGQIPEPGCGWVMIQLYPQNQLCAGVTVDFDVVQHDFQNRSIKAMYKA